MSKRTTIVLQPEQQAIVDAYAKDEGFNRSFAIRRIIMEWAKLKQHQLVDTREPYRIEVR